MTDGCTIPGNLFKLGANRAEDRYLKNNAVLQFAFVFLSCLFYFSAFKSHTEERKKAKNYKHKKGKTQNRYNYRGICGNPLSR